MDDKSEYEDIVGKILEKKPKKVTISVDMTDVKKGCQKAQVCGRASILSPSGWFSLQNNSDNSDSDKGDTEDEVRLAHPIFSCLFMMYQSNGPQLSDMEMALAKIHTQIV